MQQGGAALRANLEALTSPAAGRAALDETLTYFRNHEHKMDYPRYLACGWQIGSGAVESACKKIVGERLKGSGRRWREPGTHAVSRLRALLCSDATCRHAYWSSGVAA